MCMTELTDLSSPLLSDRGRASKLLVKTPIPLCLSENSWKERAANGFTAREKLVSPCKNKRFIWLMKLTFSANNARGSPFCGMMTFSPNWPIKSSKFWLPERSIASIIIWDIDCELDWAGVLDCSWAMDWAEGAGRDGVDNIAGLGRSAEMIATGPNVYNDQKLRDRLTNY